MQVLPHKFPCFSCSQIPVIRTSAVYSYSMSMLTS